MEPKREFDTTDDDIIANHLVAGHARVTAGAVSHEQLKTRYINAMVNAAVWRRTATAHSQAANDLIFLNKGADTLIVKGIKAYKSVDGKTIIVIGNPDESITVDEMTMKDLSHDIDLIKGAL